ncbi:MAG: SDR family NAD(P)-dependent oxidoreductase [Tetrasphaera jenkinsii]|nr:SDR family NAD(P)-dependent oxidoreductase [Tetrasphaera jenkinsii]
MPQHRNPILITGCSTGIGRASADLLVKAGYTVYATARREETLAELAAAGARTIRLDVTDEESMRAAVATVAQAHGSVGTLINNAGYGEYGTIEETDLDAVRRMFETNVFGLARLTQLCLPGMREAGGGLILNVGSMGGRIAFPVGGYYHATKYAVEGLTDALRNEVREFGIAVSLIEPGPIRTNFEESINSSAAVDNPNSPYAALVTKVQAVNADAYASKVMSVGPEAVARTLLKAVEAESPKSRYLVTPAARAMVHARRLGGDRVWDAIIGQQFR